eukprot:705580-Rhodomonas_salina.1
MLDRYKIALAVENQAGSAIGLRACYAKPGTDLVHAWATCYAMAGWLFLAFDFAMPLCCYAQQALEAGAIPIYYGARDVSEADTIRATRKRPVLTRAFYGEIKYKSRASGTFVPRGSYIDARDFKSTVPSPL